MRGARSERRFERPSGRYRRRIPAFGPIFELLSAQGGTPMKALVRDGVSRRLFLRGAGGALLALPFLQSLLPKSAEAQALTSAKRLIVFKSFSTQLIKQWYPAFTGNGYALKDSKYKDSRGDGTTLLNQKLVSGSGYSWAPF